MKKLFPIAIAMFATVSLFSCKKDYTCKCTYSSGGVTLEQTYELKKQKKKDAENACNAMQTQVGTATGVTCKL